jgi:TonB-dependent receptor
LRGVVLDKDLATPLAHVRIVVEEAGVRTTTTDEGGFVFPQLPPGSFTVTVSKDGYVRQALPGTVVTAGELTEVRVELSAEVTEMEEFVVRGFDASGGDEVGLLEIRQEAPAISDAISADLIKKAGASTAAGALRLVVGTSVQDGKYVVIRGLADRYTTTLQNGVRLPSADADKRSVQLDQFPGSLIENIVVSKTFMPDLQGDSTGGSVNIKTRAVPDAAFLSVSGAMEYNPTVSGRDDFLTYRGGGTEPFAMAGSERDLPFSKTKLPGYQGASLTPTPAQQNNAQLLDAMTRSFEPVMGTERKTVGPNYSWSVAGGDHRDFVGQTQLGFYGGFSYRQKYGYYENAKRNQVSGGQAGEPLSVTLGYADTRGTDEVLWGALTGTGWKLSEDHELGLTVSHNQTATDEARLLVGQDNPYINTALRYQERALTSTQLRGDHRFSDWLDSQLDWTLSYNIADQDDPDFRAFRETVEGDQRTITGQEFDLPRRVFRHIAETGPQANANFSIPFTQWSGTEGKVKLGSFWDDTERDFKSNTYFYNFANQLGSGPVVATNSSYVSYTGPGNFADHFLDPYRIGLATNGPPSPNQLLWYVTHPAQVDVDYRGQQEIQAAYAMAELPVTPWLRLMGGVRVEATDLQVEITSDEPVIVPTINPDGSTTYRNVQPADAGAQLEETDWLPALGLTWEVAPKLNLRLAWSQTIARPTFRELAPVPSYDFIGGDVFFGNSQLQMSHIDNYDARLEWFRRPGEVMAVGVFYKSIEDPIEQITFNISGGDRYVQRVNYPEGTLYGLEGEFRQRLDIWKDWLRDLTLGFNASYIVSEVKLPPEEQDRLAAIGANTKERQLLGQPDYLVNVNLTYENERTGTTAALFYTMTGEVLVSGESQTSTYVPNLFESPIDQLDLSLEQKLGKNWRVTFRAKNLTDPLVERVYRASWDTPEIPQSSYRRGREFSLGFNYSW